MKKLDVFMWLISVCLPIIAFSIIKITGNNLTNYSQWTLIFVLGFYGTIVWLYK